MSTTTHLDALALAAEPGAGGVTLVPYFDGERTPNRPDATGTIAGLRSDVTREQVARAAFEGVVCGLLDGLDALDGAGVATGGRLRARRRRRAVAGVPAGARRPARAAPVVVPERDRARRDRRVRASGGGAAAVARPTT